MALKKEEQVWINNLESNDEELLLKSLGDFAEKGSSALIEPIMNLLLRGENDKVSQAAFVLLCNLKDSKAIAQFFALYRQERYASVKNHLLQIIWNGNFNAETEMENLVKTAITGDLQSLFEVHTIVDNLDYVLSEETLLECISLCQVFLNQNLIHEKNDMLREILAVFMHQNEHNNDLGFDEEMA